mmetsp:Transcript_56106/g.149701  ORF Transcript_56106/g.149701 Transcript_56106/m.149701 type:complete len:230 (+) Transcript_56106:40-729(+)
MFHYAIPMAPSEPGRTSEPQHLNEPGGVQQRLHLATVLLWQRGPMLSQPADTLGLVLEGGLAPGHLPLIQVALHLLARGHGLCVRCHEGRIESAHLHQDGNKSWRQMFRVKPSFWAITQREAREILETVVPEPHRARSRKHAPRGFGVQRDHRMQLTEQCEVSGTRTTPEQEVMACVDVRLKEFAETAEGLLDDRRRHFVAAHHCLEACSLPLGKVATKRFDGLHVSGI